MQKEFWVISNGIEFIGTMERFTNDIFRDILKFETKEDIEKHIQWAETRDWGYSGMYKKRGFKPMKVIMNYEII